MSLWRKLREWGLPKDSEPPFNLSESLHVLARPRSNLSRKLLEYGYWFSMNEHVDEESLFERSFLESRSKDNIQLIHYSPLESLLGKVSRSVGSTCVPRATSPLEQYDFCIHSLNEPSWNEYGLSDSLNLELFLVTIPFIKGEEHPLNQFALLPQEPQDSHFRPIYVLANSAKEEEFFTLLRAHNYGITNITQESEHPYKTIIEQCSTRKYIPHIYADHELPT